MKEIEWLEVNMNKNGLFYFKENGLLIDCYFKEGNKHFCVFYKDVITDILKER